ncbi:hypothetical protein BDP27DRAFT_1385591 [Rhodocollybia butyracea]|uniref:Uncharacterized protein n=1 Tax=Rhodocollybia butyracea TaxID=206335 RepID=A0A9P5TZ01_9AGAR|nr:hypothetical protein BDP27DRAFT_1385591 [Rhodocollybia butyracea]
MYTSMPKARKAAEKEGKVFADSIVASELAKAFDNLPNKWSSKALELILIQKCVHEGCGKSTMDGMHAAFAKHWDEMDGEKYAGKAYRCDEKTGIVTGNPVRSHLINTFRQVMKTKAATKGTAATRNHVEAMAIKDIEAMVAWSEKECPKSMVNLVLMGTDQNTEHLCQLQHGDLTWNIHGLASDCTEHFKVHLENRKGWQKKAGYDPHPTEFEHDDFVFPFFSVNGMIQPKREFTHDMVQSLIQEAAAVAGVAKTFTTHSLCRGGAQYRFMWAEGKQHWSLTIVHWWGGWAEDERVDTLMKYLMDSLQSYETGHGNTLCPLRLEPAKSFMSDHSLDQPVTTNDFRRFAAVMISANQQDHRCRKSLKPERSAPIPGVIVPDIPKHEEGDPLQGLVKPLKDWPVEWYTGTMRLVTGTKRSNCKLVADEYER